MDRPGIVVCCALLALGGLWPAAAQEKLGEAVYVEGGVSLERNGQELDPSEVQTGLAIDNFDLVKTESDGIAEVQVKSPQAPGVTIKVSPNTQFSFELNKIGSRQQTSIGLMSGTIAFKVSKLTASQDMDIKTDTAVCGVRGTEFTVTTVPSGDMLVTCSTGDVALTDESGKEVHAVPGSAVERRAGEGFHPLAAKSADLEGFRRGWENERVAALKANALAVFQREAENYDRLVDDFRDDFAALAEKRAILDKWADEEKSGKPVSAEVEKEKAEIADLLVTIRQTQFLLARAHFRLAALRQLHEQGFGQGEIRKGESTGHFFDRFQKERKELERNMAFVRNAVRLYAHHNGGEDPTFVKDLRNFHQKRLASRKLRKKPRQPPQK